MIIETKQIPPTLSGGTLRLLCAIHDLGKPFCTEVAEHLTVSTACITQAVDMAESCSLVCRKPVEGDRRKWALELTDIGEAIIAKLQPREEAGV